MSTYAPLLFQEPLLLLLQQQLQLQQQPPLPPPQQQLLQQQQHQKHLIVEVMSMVLLGLYNHLTGQMNTHPMRIASGP